MAASNPSFAKSRPRASAGMSANPHGNGGLLLRDLRMPDFRKYAVEVKKPGATDAGGHGAWASSS
jgi:xylulose-5-phosphate/fructose-6-phosphate phosphoketolase